MGERLAAAILLLDGFCAVDPQCPLGGPDGLKDVLCEKNEWKYVAAAYFPNSEQKFKAVRDKFVDDLQGVSVNNADGIVFITNQKLSPSEREELSDLATQAEHKSLIYHLERLRALLDSPSGYGVRLQFLHIAMSQEEQLSFFSTRESSLSEALREHTTQILAELGRRFDRLEGKDDTAVPRLSNHFAQQTHAELGSSPPPSNKKPRPIVRGGAADNLTVGLLCELHSALLFGAAGEAESGALRTHNIWIGGAGASKRSAAYTPPPADQVPQLLEQLLSDWSKTYGELNTSPKAEILDAIVRFHHRFLQIHPFNDGNGRVARYLLSMQSRALLGERRPVVIEDRIPYFVALGKADAGDLSPLTELITQAVYGQDFIGGSACQMSGQRCPGCRRGTMNMAADGRGVECSECKLYLPG